MATITKAMRIGNAFRSLLLSLPLLYAAVGGLGMAAMGTMPTAGAPTCAMVGHGNPAACPMSAGDHLLSWQSAFRAAVPRQAVPSTAAPTASGIPVPPGMDPGRALARRQRGKEPPGVAPLFVRMVGSGRHQRLTYG